MATLFREELVRANNAEGNSYCGTNAELKMHGWRPNMSSLEAEAALSGKPTYTYLIRPREGERGFYFSFVNSKGYVEHQLLTLLSPSHGIWRNCGVSHIGKLAKVISDMIGSDEGQPL